VKPERNFESANIGSDKRRKKGRKIHGVKWVFIPTGQGSKVRRENRMLENRVEVNEKKKKTVPGPV